METILCLDRAWSEISGQETSTMFLSLKLVIWSALMTVAVRRYQLGLGRLKNFGIRHTGIRFGCKRADYPCALAPPLLQGTVK
jgi:hypothetical protein